MSNGLPGGRLVSWFYLELFFVEKKSCQRIKTYIRGNKFKLFIVCLHNKEVAKIKSFSSVFMWNNLPHWSGGEKRARHRSVRSVLSFL